VHALDSAGLGLYGGHDDFFLFLQRVMEKLDSSFEVVGAEEAARLAHEVHHRRRPDTSV